jgi:hypothetical protein|tara:strand:- start:2862 stop:3023 length:162 start_codon:yes stop_codon:yes gene_type:complete
MAFLHTIFYKENNSGSMLESTIIAASPDDAKTTFLSTNPDAYIDKILTTVPAK